MKKNDMLLIGGLAIAGIAALFLFKGSGDEMAPTGGGGYGGSYTGGEAGGLEDILKFGGETVNFPAPEQLDISKFLQTPEELADDGTKKSTTIAATPSVAIIGQAHPVSPATMTPVKIIGQTSHNVTSRSVTPAGTIQDGAKKAAPVVASGLLTALFPATSAARAVTSSIGSLSGGSKSSGGISATPATMTPVKIIGQTSHSGSKSKYNQAQPGAAGSGYVVRGYSLTGKPLYKPG